MTPAPNPRVADANFMLFFDEKEGTSPVVRILDHFAGVSVVRQIEGHGWEPFDSHNCGDMSTDDLRKCLDILFGQRPIDIRLLNDIYTTTARRPLERPSSAGAVGFKMRFSPPRKAPAMVPRAMPAIYRTVSPAWVKYQTTLGKFRRTMFSLIERHHVRVFIAVRQDLFRWALSKYHGDGTGRPGHLQFDLALGVKKRSDISRIVVDENRFARVIAKCESIHRQKRALRASLEARGIPVMPLIYEQFLDEPSVFFADAVRFLGGEPSESEIERALATGSAIERVHSGDVSSYVHNHREISRRFGDRFAAWE